MMGGYCAVFFIVKRKMENLQEKNSGKSECSRFGTCVS